VGRLLDIMDERSTAADAHLGICKFVTLSPTKIVRTAQRRLGGIATLFSPIFTFLFAAIAYNLLQIFNLF
jgi:hypothetical protein